MLIFNFYLKIGHGNLYSKTRRPTNLTPFFLIEVLAIQETAGNWFSSNVTGGKQNTDIKSANATQISYVHWGVL
jgi:hypothetical protein